MELTCERRIQATYRNHLLHRSNKHHLRIIYYRQVRKTKWEF